MRAQRSNELARNENDRNAFSSIAYDDESSDSGSEQEQEQGHRKGSKLKELGITKSKHLGESSDEEERNRGGLQEDEEVKIADVRIIYTLEELYQYKDKNRDKPAALQKVYFDIVPAQPKERVRAQIQENVSAERADNLTCNGTTRMERAWSISSSNSGYGKVGDDRGTFSATRSGSQLNIMSPRSPGSPKQGRFLARRVTNSMSGSWRNLSFHLNRSSSESSGFSGVNRDTNIQNKRANSYAQDKQQRRQQQQQQKQQNHGQQGFRDRCYSVPAQGAASKEDPWCIHQNGASPSSLPDQLNCLSLSDSQQSLGVASLTQTRRDTENFQMHCTLSQKSTSPDASMSRPLSTSYPDRWGSGVVNLESNCKTGSEFRSGQIEPLSPANVAQVTSHQAGRTGQAERSSPDRQQHVQPHMHFFQHQQLHQYQEPLPAPQQQQHQQHQQLQSPNYHHDHGSACLQNFFPQVQSNINCASAPMHDGPLAAHTATFIEQPWMASTIQHSRSNVYGAPCIPPSNIGSHCLQNGQVQMPASEVRSGHASAMSPTPRPDNMRLLSNHHQLGRPFLPHPQSPVASCEINQSAFLQQQSPPLRPQEAHPNQTIYFASQFPPQSPPQAQTFPQEEPMVHHRPGSWSPALENQTMPNPFHPQNLADTCRPQMPVPVPYQAHWPQ